MNSQTIVYAAFTVVSMILSVTVHEWAHAFTATKLGDDTPTEQGRVTLNPVAHIDPIGTLAMPLVGALIGGFLIGWARPVQYRPSRIRKDIGYRKGGLMIALAGPASNLVLLVLCLAGLKVLLSVFGMAGLEAQKPLLAFANLLAFMTYINLILAFFNLLPVPPLDGFAMLEHTLPADSRVVQIMRDYQLVFFILAIFVVFRMLAVPMFMLLALLLQAFGISAEFGMLMPIRG